MTRMVFASVGILNGSLYLLSGDDYRVYVVILCVRLLDGWLDCWLDDLMLDCGLTYLLIRLVWFGYQNNNKKNNVQRQQTCN